ncbi:uncharacterized protein [Fopius arisanus]|uniref:FLYWCH-type domain-containing protein n=1 Tax=Fopius arisanus TaxID=64838 RepID=A0A9R1U9I7_9HYME|nr:PREDICTED: uncharacterized protein LOC105272779 [Fopius arisanus]
MMKKIPGYELVVIDDKNGKVCYLHNNFRYHFASSSSQKTIYRCAYYQSIYQCKVKLWKTRDGKVTVVGGEHHHDDAKNAREVAAMKIEMKKQACSTHDFPSRIIHEVERNHPIARRCISILASNSYIRRKRDEIGRPKEPATLEELANTLETNEEMKDVVKSNYRGIVHPEGENAGCALLFVHDDMLEEFNTAKIIEIDETMKAVPTTPEGTQIWIISV